MAWLTISIDLCGSTKIKQAIVECSTGDPVRRRDLYDEYLKTLYATEHEFYALLLTSDGVDFEKLSLIKMIGDELWFFYEVLDGDEELVEATCGILEALLELCSRERYLHLDGGAPIRKGERKRLDELRSTQFDIPIKACIDLIIEPIEMTAARYEFLKDIVSLADGKTSAVYKVDQEFLAYCNRLNLAAPSPLGAGRRVTTRADYIGLEVDRFFRLTGLCLPRLLGIGDTLYSKLPISLAPAQRGHEHLDIKIAEFGLGKDKQDRQPANKYLISEIIPSAKMKGISEDYAIHHLFGAESLGESVFCPPAGIDTLVESTRAFLAEHGFYSLDRDQLLP